MHCAMCKRYCLVTKYWFYVPQLHASQNAMETQTGKPEIILQFNLVHGSPQFLESKSVTFILTG